MFFFLSETAFGRRGEQQERGERRGGGASRPPLGFLSLAGIGPLARVAFRGPSHHLKQSPIEKTAGRSGRQQLVQNNTASHASLPRQCALRFAFVWDRCVCVCVRVVLWGPTTEVMQVAESDIYHHVIIFIFRTVPVTQNIEIGHWLKES